MPENLGDRNNIDTFCKKRRCAVMSAKMKIKIYAAPLPDLLDRAPQKVRLMPIWDIENEFSRSWLPYDDGLSCVIKRYRPLSLALADHFDFFIPKISPAEIEELRFSEPGMDGELDNIRDHPLDGGQGIGANLPRGSEHFSDILF